MQLKTPSRLILTLCRIIGLVYDFMSNPIHPARSWLWY